MNLGSANVVLRPRSARESFDLAFPFLIHVGGVRYLWLCVLVLGPALVGCASLGLWLGWSELEVWLLAVPLGVWLQGLFTLAAGELMFSVQLEPRTLLRSFAKRLPTYSLGLLTSRALGLLLVSTVVFAPWAWSRVAFVPEILLLEGLSVAAAHRRASRFGKSSGGVMLAFWLAGAVGYFVLAGRELGTAVVHFILQVPAPRPAEAMDLTTVYALCGWFSSLPLLATVRFFRYVDERTRSDGWDVQVKLQRMAQDAKERA